MTRGTNHSFASLEDTYRRRFDSDTIAARHLKNLSIIASGVTGRGAAPVDIARVAIGIYVEIMRQMRDAQ